MRWPDVEQIARRVALPKGYTATQLKIEEIDSMIDHLRVWFPDMVVSSEAYHLDREFYLDRTLLAGVKDAPERGSLPLVIKDGEKIVFFVTLQREVVSRTVTGRCLAIDPTYRGYGLANVAPKILLAMADMMGAELAYYYASLTSIRQQKAAEQAGFKLIGIMPASDRHVLPSGSVKRVMEAIYARVMVSEDEIVVPALEGMTPQTRAMWNFLYGNISGREPVKENIAEPLGQENPGASRDGAAGEQTIQVKHHLPV